MPRRRRLAIPHIPLHVTQRGNNRCACFIGDSDRLVYLDLLATQTRLHDLAVHAYVLMTNHVHLLVTPNTPSALGKGMRHVNQRYAQYFNRRHERTGTLWEGRPYSCLVDAQAYLLTCHRYVENNPVRARMVERAEDYRWSSHRANAFGEHDPVLTSHPLVVALGRSADERLREYRELFRTEDAAGTIEQIRSATAGGLALGRESFAKDVARALDRRATRGKPGRPYKRQR